MPKRTYSPKKMKVKKTHGYRVRTSSAKGKKVIARRMLKGRHSLTA